MKVSVYGESRASRIRQVWDDLFTSRHVRFLEAELARVRAEKDAEIQRLSLAILNQRIAVQTPARPVTAMAPMSTGPMISTYESELAAHNKKLQEEESKEQSNGVQKH